MKRTYLDWAAAAPLMPRAERAFRHALGVFGNPASPHSEGRAASEILEDARVRIARLAGVKSDAVVFTAGATEANALGIVGQVRALWDRGRAPESMHVLYLPSAHASTRGCVEELASWGVQTEALSIINGSIALARLKEQVRPETVLVAIEAVCGETGARFATRDVRRTLDQVRAGIRLHVDASQLPWEESFERTRLGADTLSLDAQKVGGVRGIGVLIVPRHVEIAPLLRGGGQERGLRPGTPSHALASAFATALEDTNEQHAAFSLRAGVLRERLLKKLCAIENVVENRGKENLAHIVNISLLGRDTDYLAVLLDEAGFAVSTRSACATDDEGSNAVRVFTDDIERARCTLRISWGPSIKPKELDRFADALMRAIRFLDSHAV